MATVACFLTTLNNKAYFICIVLYCIISTFTNHARNRGGGGGP